MKRKLGKKTRNAEPRDDQAGPDTSESTRDGQTTAAAADQEPAPDDSPDRLRKRIDELEDALLRARAEQQNIRRRAANEMADAVNFANAGLLKALLNVVDDLERALEGGETPDAKAFMKGVHLVHENLVKVLRDHRVETIHPAGKPFDPTAHEAVQQIVSQEDEPGTVAHVVQKGYKLGERVLRPAKVVVTTRPEHDAPDARDGSGDDGEATERSEHNGPTPAAPDPADPASARRS